MVEKSGKEMEPVSKGSLRRLRKKVGENRAQGGRHLEGVRGRGRKIRNAGNKCGKYRYRGERCRENKGAKIGKNEKAGLKKKVYSSKDSNNKTELGFFGQRFSLL